jgi:HAD superfamily hydrolase (TIGR01509 family)
VAADRAPQPPVSLVIFDCDGVLVDSEGISSRELARSIGEVGLAMSWEEVKATFKGRSLADIAAAVERRIGRALPRGWLGEFERRRAAAFRDGLRAVPGADAAVRAVQASGIDTCVASQASLEKTNLTLGLTGLRSLFADDRLFSAGDVARGKPAPDLFLHAAAACGHAPPSCVVVEDGAAGALAARAAGMRVLGYASGSDAGALSAAGAEVFFDMREAPERIRASITQP